MYWFPNRPLLQTRDFLARMDAGDVPGKWWAEPKWNGDRLVLIRGGNWSFWNRHKGLLKYRPPAGMLEELEDIAFRAAPDRSGRVVMQLDGELVHNHTKNVKDKIVLYDVYDLGGEPVRSTLADRREWLDQVVLDGHFVEKAERIFSGFQTAYDALTMRSEIEGLVFKEASGKLDFNPVKSPDVPWQIKVRKAAKNYKF